VSFGLLTGLGAALAWGTMDIGSALAGRRVGSLAVTAGGQVVSGVILFGLIIASGSSLPSDPRAIVLSAFVGVVGAGGSVWAGAATAALLLFAEARAASSN